MTDQSAVAATQSVLDKLVAGVSDRKAAKATRLTPTTSEAKLAPALPSASFPYDNPETMIRALQVARVEVEHVRDGIDAIIFALGGALAEATSPVAVKKASEKAADAAAALRATAVVMNAPTAVVADNFATQFASRQAEAQAATFTPQAVSTGVLSADGAAKAARIAAMKAELEELNR